MTLRGGKINVSPAFLLLAAWLLYHDQQGIVFPALLACCLHEAGHVLVIRLVGGNIKQFNITVVGAELVLLHPLSYGRELLSAAAGEFLKLKKSEGFTLIDTETDAERAFASVREKLDELMEKKR